jgi:hypothetical protein
VGHRTGAYNIPLRFHTTETTRRGYGKVPNENFIADLKALFNPETDTILFICRLWDASNSMFLMDYLTEIEVKCQRSVWTSNSG